VLQIAELFVYDNFNRVPTDEVKAGDICALAGIGVRAAAACVWCEQHQLKELLRQEKQRFISI
jgi:predicted membrane GTPase involved in stress response